MCTHSSSGEKDITPRHLLVCVKNPGFLNVQLLQIACLCSARLTACFPQMLEPPHLLHSTSGPVLAQGGALAFLASIVTRWCSHKLEHLYSLHLSRMCLYSPHLLHLISGPVLAQAGAPAFLASTPYALVLAQRVPPTRHAAAGATVQPSGKREGRFAKVVARSMPLAEHASLIIVCVLGPNRKLVVQLREACCMQ